MRKWLLAIGLICGFEAAAQEHDEFAELNSASLEELAETEDYVNDDEHNAQELLEYRRHKLSINGTRDELSAFPLFESHHVENILQYRKLLGEFISIYELQAVPGFSIQLLRQLAPYISISRGDLPVKQLRNAFRDGNKTLVARPVIIPQKANGFRSDDNPPKFLGDRLGFLVRFKYKYRKQLQYGFTVEKDPGETLLMREFPWVGDFQSGHLMIKDVGKIKTLALGDYTINMGQGLIHWQSQAFRKSASVLNVKRQGDLIKPYQSVGEYNFLRGIAVATSIGKTEIATFFSRRMLTANIGLNERDKQVITSINLSGLHRSANERSDRNSAHIISSGTRLKWSAGSTAVCWNIVYHRYSMDVEKRNEPHNIFSFKGNTWANSSLDFATTIRNYHVFGEYAADARKNPAAITGLVSSVNRSLDVVFLFRHISRRYQSLYGNAFTENSVPGNEQGFYSGISFRPAAGWRVDTYMDLFRFHWLKYRVDAPAHGMHYFVQVTWKPSKTVECYWRVRNRMKPINFDAEEAIDFPEMTITKNWRTHIVIQLNKTVNVRGRLEMCSYQSSPGGEWESGYLYFTELTIKPLFRSYSFNMRLQYFEAESFNTRIYAFEKDLLMTTNIPAFQDRGLRYYLNFSTKHALPFFREKQIHASFKFASLTYFNRLGVGSGDSEIPGNTKTDIRFQLVIL